MLAVPTPPATPSSYVRFKPVFSLAGVVVISAE